MQTSFGIKTPPSPPPVTLWVGGQESVWGKGGDVLLSCTSPTLFH